MHGPRPQAEKELDPKGYTKGMEDAQEPHFELTEMGKSEEGEALAAAMGRRSKMEATAPLEKLLLSFCFLLHFRTQDPKATPPPNPILPLVLSPS